MAIVKRLRADISRINNCLLVTKKSLCKTLSLRDSLAQTLERLESPPSWIDAG